MILGVGVVKAADSGADHWAYQELRRPTVPAVRDAGWVRNDIDRFVLARLEASGLSPGRPASREALLRRVTLDLTGLPPRPEEIEAFLADRSPDAFSKVTERLLASPHYGERWGRHWMDVVRYADTAGDNADYPVPELHRYRDYIIRSFNEDKPYDRFVQEQLAGDVLAAAAGSSWESYADSVVATGFLAVSRRYGTGPYELWHLTLENTIETVGEAFLALNLRCARCHDHKFEPVKVSDYYGLYGIFASTEFPWAGSEEIQSKNFNRQKFVPLVSAEEAAARISAWEARLRGLREELAGLEAKPATDKAAPDAEALRKRVEALKKELRTLEKPGAPPDLPVAYAVREGKPADVAIQLRGVPSTPGPMAPRCVPRFLENRATGERGLQIAEGSSGRLEFARWLTARRNPLTARVMVNRIWQHLFGSGLVRTPNHFGIRGDIPVHRELLDHLAVRFMEGTDGGKDAWSIKALHRWILDSATYRLSSDSVEAAMRVDPSNRLLWRQDRRRLDAESIRDAMLWASGDLELGQPGAHPFPGPAMWTWTQHAPFKDRYETRHRSVYLMTQRFQRHPFLALFDGPDTNHSTEARRASIVPQQALYLMNHPWVEERAWGVARRLVGERTNDTDRLKRLILVAWGRRATEVEVEAWLGRLEELRRASAVVAESCEEELGSWVVLARVALLSNEFLYVD